MKYAIVGSRDYPDLAEVRACVETLPRDSIIVSGGARGVDSAAAQAARDLGMEVIEYLPDWDLHGKAAGFIRNKYIIDNADHVIAFHCKGSRGTQHSIDLARQQKKPLEVYTK